MKAFGSNWWTQPWSTHNVHQVLQYSFFERKKTTTFQFLIKQSSSKSDEFIAKSFVITELQKRRFITVKLTKCLSESAERNFWLVKRMSTKWIDIHTAFSVRCFAVWSRYWAAMIQTSGWWLSTSKHCSVANMTRLETSAVSSLRSGFCFSKLMNFRHNSTWNGCEWRGWKSHKIYQTNLLEFLFRQCRWNCW